MTASIPSCDQNLGRLISVEAHGERWGRGAGTRAVRAHRPRPALSCCWPATTRQGPRLGVRRPHLFCIEARRMRRLASRRIPRVPLPEGPLPYVGKHHWMSRLGQACGNCIVGHDFGMWWRWKKQTTKHWTTGLKRSRSNVALWHPGATGLARNQHSQPVQLFIWTTRLSPSLWPFLRPPRPCVCKSVPNQTRPTTRSPSLPRPTSAYTLYPQRIDVGHESSQLNRF